MSYMGSREGASVCLDRYSQHEHVIDMQMDHYGSPEMVLKPLAKFWFQTRGLVSEWWIDDLGDIWFEFDSRGDALLFMLECVG